MKIARTQDITHPLIAQKDVFLADKSDLIKIYYKNII